MVQVPAISARLGEFAAGLDLGDVPDEVVHRATHLILDAVGVAFASTRYEFADKALAALQGLGPGDHPVIGLSARLSPRDGALLNGMLVHGLDYDDTHLASVTHVTASALPLALAAAQLRDGSTRDLLLAYILAVEVSARVGLGAKGSMHDVGFHPTGVAGAFGCAVAASRLRELDADRIAMAQGTVGSMAAGLFEFLDDGAWTKRQHPGWAAVCGLTAAALAEQGWVGPPKVYEGRFGLYATHLAGHEPDLDAVAADLGERWELLATAVKPYPTCHFTHAFADAVLKLVAQHDTRVSDIDRIRCLIHRVPGKVVCEPAKNKRRPRDHYDAKFSLPFIVAVSAVHRRFTLADLDDATRSDPAVLDLVDRVDVADDPESNYPEAYSGVVEIHLRDGRTLRHREDINRGHEKRPLSPDDIVGKFDANMALATTEAKAACVRERVLNLAEGSSARSFAEACATEDAPVSPTLSRAGPRGPSWSGFA